MQWCRVVERAVQWCSVVHCGVVLCSEVQCGAVVQWTVRVVLWCFAVKWSGVVHAVVQWSGACSGEVQ
mgnify:CR=1 FL=1